MQADNLPCTSRPLVKPAGRDLPQFCHAILLHERPVPHSKMVTCCGRYGVSCCATTPMLLSSGCTNVVSQSVAVLEVGNFNLSGSLPQELGVLTALSTVYLSDNPGERSHLL